MNGEPKLRCFCNQRPSDVNFVSMLVRVSPLNFAQDEERETTEKPMGSRSLYEPASHLLFEVSLSNHAVHNNRTGSLYRMGNVSF